jgi:hypothetical protein
MISVFGFLSKIFSDDLIYKRLRQTKMLKEHSQTVAWHSDAVFLASKM